MKKEQRLWYFGFILMNDVPIDDVLVQCVEEHDEDEDRDDSALNYLLLF